MPKFNFKNKIGSIDSKQLAFIGTFTAIAILIIIIIFVFIINRKKTPTTDSSTNQFLQNIEKQRSSTKQDSNQNTPEAAIVEEKNKTFTGPLTSIASNYLVIAEDITGEKITFNITAKTPMLYNEKTFNRSDLLIGDVLKIKAEKSGKNWDAQEIIILVSGSPKMPAPLPPAVNKQPDGTYRPL